MDRQELGAFLRSRRERLRPEDVGLPSGPRRRTPGLRREEVAVLAYISTEYYVRLEQGRAPRPSGEVLAGIAGALRLTDAESDHLHVLAGTARTRTGLHRRDVRPSILALLERLPPTAAFVTSAAFEVLAWNDLAAALMEDFARLTPENRNLARRAFLGPVPPDAPLYGISDGAEFRHHVVLELRATLARYPTDPAVTGLIEELRSATYAQAARRLVEGGTVDPPVLLALDEVANVAPIPDLAGIVSDGAGQGLLTLACLQDLSQARVRWGPAADGFMSLFGTKVILPGIGDLRTLEQVSALGGETDVMQHSVSRAPWRPWNRVPRYSTTTYSRRQRRLPVDSVAQGALGQALVIDGPRPPAWIRLTPWYATSPWSEIAGVGR